MTRFAFGAAAAALALAVPGAAMAQRGAQILVVDTDRILAQCTACVAANTQLGVLYNNAQQRATQLRGPIEAEANSVEQAANSVRGMPAGAARTQQEATVRQRIQALETRQNQANQELQKLETNLQSTRANVARQVGERITTISNQVLTQRGAMIVLAKGTTLANADSVDITNEVLTALNQQLPAVSVTPMPQQQQPQGR